MPMNTEASRFLESVIRVVEGTDDLPRHSRIVMAQELHDLRRALNADFTEMQQQIEVAADCVQRIVDNWQSGDLAHAVNMAEEWRTEAMTIFPDFNWIDDEADSDDDDFDHAAAADGKSTFDHDRAQDGINPIVEPQDVDGWSASQQNAALADGWGLFNISTHTDPGDSPFQLQKYDEAGRFDNDSDAWDHVIEKAAQGSDLHKAALDFLKENSPAEYRDIIKLTE